MDKAAIEAGYIAEFPLDKIRIPEGVVIDPAVVEDFLQAKCLEDLRPHSIFVDFTFLRTEEFAQRVSRHFVNKGCTAVIDRHPEHGLLLHSYMDEHFRMWRKPISKEFDTPSTARVEREMEREICEWLESLGRKPERQVGCAAGIADIVTVDSIYEVKALLNRSHIVRAVGQVLLYRQAINPRLRAVVIGGKSKDVTSMREFATPLGVSIVLWPEARNG